MVRSQPLCCLDDAAAQNTLRSLRAGYIVLQLHQTHTHNRTHTHTQAHAQTRTHNHSVQTQSATVPWAGEIVGPAFVAMLRRVTAAAGDALFHLLSPCAYLWWCRVRMVRPANPSHCGRCFNAVHLHLLHLISPLLSSVLLSCCASSSAVLQLYLLSSILLSSVLLPCCPSPSATPHLLSSVLLSPLSCRPTQLSICSLPSKHTHARCDERFNGTQERMPACVCVLAPFMSEERQRASTILYDLSQQGVQRPSLLERMMIFNINLI